MKKIGDPIMLFDVRRAMHWNGHPAYFDEGITIEGRVVTIAYFVFKRICVAFKHDGRDYTLCMDDYKEPECVIQIS